MKARIKGIFLIFSFFSLTTTQVVNYAMKWE